MAEHVNWHKADCFSGRFLGEWDLPDDSEIAAKITDIKHEMVAGQNGTQEMKTIIYLEGLKPMICNKTNIKNIAKACGTDYEDEMCGHYIQLYKDMVSSFGTICRAVRVRDFEPKVDK